jgi:hypothetical protein
MIADLITPEVRELMDRIEHLAEERGRQPRGSGFTVTDQLFGAATYFGAPKLVAALRAIEAQLAPPAETVDDGQLALDLAA